jgi:hypothetical protein
MRIASRTSWSRVVAVIAGLALVPLVPAASLAAEAETDGVVYGGIYSERATGNITADLNALNSATGRKVTFGGSFSDVCETSGSYVTGVGWSCTGTKNHDPNQYSVTRAMLNEVWLAQATPFVNLGINASAASIASGSWDTRITQWATHVKGYLDLGGGRTVIIAPLQEMNSDWVPYGCDPTNYKVAHQRIVNIFRGLGMGETKVRWSFSPNGWTTPGCGSIASYYPGHGFVDVLGVSAYNFGTCVGFGWETPYQVLHDPLTALRLVGPYKPIVVAQTAAPRNSCGAPSGHSQSTWVNDLFAYAASAPSVAGIVYFNIIAGTDYRVWENPSLVAGWSQGMNRSSTKYQWPLTSWFQPGPLVTDTAPGDPCPDGKDCDTIALVDAGAQWHLHTALGWSDPVQRFYFGNSGDYPIMGDWNCNGTKSPGMYRQSDGFVYLRNSNTQGVADVMFFFGNPGDIPIAGDFNGNGCDTVSIYRPSNQTFYIINQLGTNGGGLGAAQFSYVFGNPGDKPFVGDFNGNGQDTVGLHRESTGLVYYRNTHTQGNADNQFIFGNPGDKIFAGDWNGDGVDTVGIYRPSNGTVYLRFTNTQGNADHTLSVGSFIGVVRA